MTDEQMDKFLESIGGLENGFFTDRPPITSCGFFACGKGWYPLIKGLIEDLIALGWDKKICQVKEKFGGLRFYINSGSDEIHNRISKAENDSYDICERTGKPVNLETTLVGGQHYAMKNIKKHWKEEKNDMKKEIPTHDPYTGELNPYYEELTGQPNPLLVKGVELNKFKKVCLEISKRLSNLSYDDGDGSDIGNEVGIIIAKHFSEDHGWDMDGFFFGVNHGIDLTLNKDKDE